jgi:DNA-binding HxlR family transcriptional regulator
MLKGLQRDGLVTRTAYATNPPRADYSLTARGQTLIAPVPALWTWAQENCGGTEADDRKFDDGLRDKR